jgi:hypothetical protein
MVNKMYYSLWCKIYAYLVFRGVKFVKLDQIYIKRINSSFTKKEIHISHYLVCCGKE